MMPLHMAAQTTQRLAVARRQSAAAYPELEICSKAMNLIGKEEGRNIA
jgi:hypothetical protein